jgi:hypothetical protein
MDRSFISETVRVDHDGGVTPEVNLVNDADAPWSEVGDREVALTSDSPTRSEAQPSDQWKGLGAREPGRRARRLQ